eukprot:1075220-Prorocentrum_minimum.AAC.2
MAFVVCFDGAAQAKGEVEGSMFVVKRYVSKGTRSFASAVLRDRDLALPLTFPQYMVLQAFATSVSVHHSEPAQYRCVFLTTNCCLIGSLSSDDAHNLVLSERLLLVR